MIKEETFQLEGETYYTKKFSAMTFPTLVSSMMNILEMTIADAWHKPVREKAEIEFLDFISSGGRTDLSVEDAKQNIHKYKLTENERLKHTLELLWYCYRNISCLSDVEMSVIEECNFIVNTEFVNEIDIEKILFGNLYTEKKVRKEIDEFVLFLLSKTHVFEQNGTIKFTFDNIDDVGEKINNNLMFLSKLLFNVLKVNFADTQQLLKSELDKIDIKKK